MDSGAMIYKRDSLGSSLSSAKLLVLTLTSTCLIAAGAARAEVAVPATAAVSSWELVQQLAPNTRLKVSADRHGGGCVLQSVAMDALICAHGNSTRTTPRAEIKGIRLARRGRSAAVGLGIGAAVGVGVGVGIGEGINTSDQGSLLHVSGGKAAGVGAAIGVILGAGVGAAVGYASDFMAGAVIYKR